MWMWSPMWSDGNSKKTVETISPKEEESGKDFSAADALIATEIAREDLEYQMKPVYAAIKFAAKQGRTGCVIYGENKSWNYVKWRSSNPSQFDSSYTEQIVRKLGELGYHVKKEWTLESCDSDYKLTISWGEEDD